MAELYQGLMQQGKALGACFVMTGKRYDGNVKSVPEFPEESGDPNEYKKLRVGKSYLGDAFIFLQPQEERRPEIPASPSFDHHIGQE